MEFENHVTEYIKESTEERIYSNKELRRLVSFIDLTSLNINDDEESIKKLCKKANSPFGTVAAVCVYSQAVPIAAKHLKKEIQIVSVANFPTGENKLEITLSEINFALSSGATEIDIVLPFNLYKEGRKIEALNYLKECKKACGKAKLKVILEISEFEHLEDIYALSKDVMTTGANFLKTSTGKSQHGATIAGASAMLLAIKASTHKEVGFKASGGIKTINQAFSYIELAKKIMGDAWLNRNHFRLGASSLLDEVLAFDGP